MAKGWVYVMTTKTHTGMVKIGKTENHPSERAKQLSSTSLPFPMVIKYAAKVPDCDLAEVQLHAAFTRENAGKEWFYATVPQVVKKFYSKDREIYDEIIKFRISDDLRAKRPNPPKPYVPPRRKVYVEKRADVLRLISAQGEWYGDKRFKGVHLKEEKSWWPRADKRREELYKLISTLTFELKQKYGMPLPPEVNSEWNHRYPDPATGTLPDTYEYVD